MADSDEVKPRMDSLLPPQIDQIASDTSEIAAFKNRRNKRRPTLANQYRLLAQRRARRGSTRPGAQQPFSDNVRRQSQQPNDSKLYTEQPSVAAGDSGAIKDPPDVSYPLEAMKSSHAYEAHTINWKEAQEEKELKKRQQKVLQSAGPFRRHMYALTESIFFNGIILVVILLNTAILCALTFNIVVVRAGWYFTFLDYIFLVIYFIECILKIYVWRLDYFKEMWNIIDFFIVQTNIADFLVSTLVGSSVGILQFITIFRAMRALRALRVLKTVRFLKSLQVIMTTCLQSVQSMGAITMLISLFLYMFAVIGRGLYAEVDPERFGNLGNAMLTLFQLLTLDDWFYVYSDAIAKDPKNWHIIVYLIMYIATEYFVFLNLFVAVLVDNFQLTIEAAAESEAQRKAILKAEEDKAEDELARQENLEAKESLSSETVVKVRKTVNDYYTNEREYPTSDKEHLGHFLRLLAALEFNGHVLNNQQGTLNKMVDIVQVPMDDA